MDGQAIARAVLEYVHDRVRPEALFATHYHDLTALAVERPGMANFNVLVVREGDEIRFCHRIQPGAADHSYGIEVARLAGLPSGVLARARELQLELETGRLTAVAREETTPVRQIPLFAQEKEKICEALSALKLEEMTPVAALNWLLEAQAELGGRSASGRRGKKQGR